MVAIFLFTLCAAPVFAISPKPCAAEFSFQSIASHDVQIGQPVTITWSYSGKPVIAQTIDISDVGYGTQLGVDQRSYTYVPSKPGEVHVQVNASSGCDFVKGETQFHVRQCNVAPREMTLQGEQVLSGESFAASVALSSNEVVRWDVRGGAIASQNGGSVSIIAGVPGTLEIDAYVSKGDNCELKISRSVPITCATFDMEMYLNGPEVISGNTFGAWVDYRPDQTVRWEVRGATVLYTDFNSVGIQTTAPGTLEIDAYITRPGFCELKISRSVPIVCYSDPDRVITMQPSNATTPGGTVLAFVNVFPWFNETVRYEVRNGTIQSIDGLNVWLTAGEAGTMEMDAYITHGGCTFKVTRSIPVVE